MTKFKEKLEIDLLKAMTYTEINNLLNKLNRQIETLQKKVNQE
jgi:ribosome-associated translation inhibitor RaiA